MSAFLGLSKEPYAMIPAHVRGEFKQCLETLLQTGGMMEIEHIQLCGRKINVIKKVSMHKHGMSFCYSYFDDAIWEGIGFDKKRYRVLGGMVGGECFILVVLAAYVLEGLYTEGKTECMMDGKRMAPYLFMEWIRYLFPDAYYLTKAYGSELSIIEPRTTERFLRISHDNMILFWEEGGNIQFSEDWENWFKELKTRYEQIIAVDVGEVKGLEWIIDIMEYADKYYYRIYAIADFFKETREHLDDCRYLALWKIYEEMLHDPELEEAGSVIYSSNNPQYKDRDEYHLRDQRTCCLKDYWDYIDTDERNNKARVTFKRYMALVANKELRKKVFGF